MFNFIFVKNMYMFLNFKFLKMNMLLMLLLSMITFTMIIYSKKYLYFDMNKNMFNFLIYIFALGMFMCFISNNWMLFFMGWEMLGILSYFLMNYWNFSIEANKGSIKALFWNKLGDLFLFTFILALWYLFLMYTMTMEIFLYNYMNNKTQNLMLLMMVLMPVCIKSVQFLLNNWIFDAMEGPTPVSAFLHSSTMVVAGSFLLFLILNLFTINFHMYMYMMSFIGLLTGIFSSLNGIYSKDIKNLLAASTSSHMSIMFLSLSLGLEVYYIFHVVTHAFFKLTLFLLFGILMHKYYDMQDISLLSFMYNKEPLLYMFTMMLVLSLMGFPSMLSSYSKEPIILNFMLLNKNFFFFCLIFNLSLTMLYSIKLLLLFNNYMN